jgi:HlyD family secretion protein
MARNGSALLSKPVLIAAGIVLVGGLAAGFMFGWGSIGSKDSGAEMRAVYVVQRRDLPISVTQAGEIQARSYTDYICEVEGRPSIVEIVREGTYISEQDVKKGRIIVQLDTSELQELYTKQKITFAAAEAEFTGATESLAIQTNQNESDVQAALLAVKFARMDLEKYLSQELADDLIKRAAKSPDKVEELLVEFIKEMVKAPDSPKWGGAALQSKRVLESNIKLAKGMLKKDDNRLRGTKRLHDKEYVAASELESDELSRQRSEIDVQQAETAMALFMRYDLAKEIEKLFSDYQEAKRALDRTRASVRSKLAQAQAKLDSAKATYALQKERREKLETQLAACTIRATTAGLVIYSTSMNYEARERDPIEIGDIVHKGQKMITIPNSSQVAGVVRVHESWIERVHPGLPVRVTADPFPDSVFSGSVETVSPLPDAQSRWANTGLKVYTTHVSIDGRDHVLRPGMSAKIEIVIDELKDVLCVPLQSVASTNGTKTCYLVTSSGLEERVVETGQYNDSFVEITSGLSVGEVVSLIPPRLDEAIDEKADDEDKSPKTSKSKPLAKGKGPKKPSAKPARKPANSL